MKCAICLRGAVAKITHRFIGPGELYNGNEYINYNAVYESIMKHIVLPNPHIQFDFFIQCWNLDLEEELTKLYNPKATKFEDNNNYAKEIIQALNNTNKPMSHFGSNSQLLSISNSLNLLKEYVSETNTQYDYVMCYRPDVLLWKDIDFNNYDPNKIYVNGYNHSIGDFHFIMNFQNSILFSKIYSTSLYNNVVTNSPLHWKFRTYVEQIMKQQLHMDDIVPGKFQEVMRKLKKVSVCEHGVSIDTFYKYGLTDDEINKYVVDG